MATAKSYCEFVVEQLRETGKISCRPMMGEYMLYCNSVLFGGVYDNRLLIKRTTGNAKFDLPEVIPYPHAKPMHHIEDVEDCNLLVEIVTTTVADLRS